MSRFTRIAAVLSAAALTIVMAGTAQASHSAAHSAGHECDPTAAWCQTDYQLTCRGAAEGADGGTVYTRLTAHEVRAEEQDFVMSYAWTHWTAEKNMNELGWVPLVNGPKRKAITPQYHERGGLYYSRFRWTHFQTPLTPLFVAPVPTNGEWRLVLTTDVYNEDGIQVAEIQNTTPSCYFAGKR